MKINSACFIYDHPEDRYLTNQLAMEDAIKFMLEQRQEVEERYNCYGQKIIRSKSAENCKVI
jgi:hypothetical protein